jgi:hypothetical protein
VAEREYDGGGAAARRTRGGGATVGVRRKGRRHRRSRVGPALRRPLLAAHQAACSELGDGLQALAAGTVARKGGRWDGVHVDAEQFTSMTVWIRWWRWSIWVLEVCRRRRIWRGSAAE